MYVVQKMKNLQNNNDKKLENIIQKYGFRKRLYNIIYLGILVFI